MMKKTFLTIWFLLSCLIVPALANVTGGVSYMGPITPSDCASWLAPGILQDAGACGGGGGGTPGTPTNSVQYNSSGSFAGSANLTWLNTSGFLGIGTTVPTAPLTIGTPAITDTGILAQATSSTNSYNQFLIQNTSNGAAASTNFIVNNDQGTATTNYGEFGMNSSGFTGTGNFSKAGAVYLDAESGDLSIGTISSSAIHFITANAPMDAVTISGGGSTTVNGTLQINSNVNILSTSISSIFDSANGTNPIFQIFNNASSAINGIGIKGSSTGVTPIITNLPGDTAGLGLGVEIDASGAGSAAGAGGPIVIKAGAAGTTGNNPGGAISITSGAANGSASSGAINITGGAGTVSAGGGAAVTITGGTTGGGGTGGAANIIGGAGLTSGVGGPVNITGGAAAGANTSGSVTIKDGASGTAASGNISIATNSAATNAGNISLTAGPTTGNGTGGNISLTAGLNAGAGNNGGNISLTGGASAASGGAGTISLLTGAGATTVNSGGLSLTTGAAGATANSGAINLTTGPGGATSGNSGNINLQTGTVTSGSVGEINIGTTVALSGANLNVNSHIGFTQNVLPVATSCSGGAVSSGSSDHKGQIAGITAATSCTLTFNSALPNSPSCVATGSTAIVSPSISAISTTAVTFTMSIFTGTLYYMCF